jgi:hypothetical protein
MKMQVLFETEDKDLIIDGWVDSKQRRYTIKPGMPLEVKEHVAKEMVKVYPFLKVSEVGKVEKSKKTTKAKTAIEIIDDLINEGGSPKKPSPKKVAEDLMSADQKDENALTHDDINKMNYKQLREVGVERGVFKVGMNTPTLRKALNDLVK